MNTTYIILILALFAVFNTAAINVYLERRISAFIQNRVGPNRVGPLGLFQPLADVIKLIFKEDITPEQSKKWLHTISPLIPVVTALLIIPIIPFGENIFVTDLEVGVLLLLGISSLGVYGVTLAGWASNSKYSLLGGLRASAQMISYELPLGIALASCVLFSESLNINILVDSQGYWWNIFRNPIGAIIFIITAFAETNRTPFDIVEAEQELVGGYHTEYSSMKFGMFFLAEYMHITIASMLITVFFFGGYHLPLADYWLPEISPIYKNILDILVFSSKTALWIFIFIWVRWTLPRFKFSQIMQLGWEKLLPLSIINFLAIAIILYTI